MANTGVKGRVVDQNGAGIKDLTIRAVDFDPFFNEDDVLATGKTDADGQFQLSYTADAYSVWKFDRKPDIVVQVFGPSQPFGGYAHALFRLSWYPVVRSISLAHTRVCVSLSLLGQ